jgi:hypothetical protein
MDTALIKQQLSWQGDKKEGKRKLDMKQQLRETGPTGEGLIKISLGVCDRIMCAAGKERRSRK